MEQLTNEIRLATETLSSCGDGSSPEQKQDLLIAATELVEKLEGPEVGIWRVVFGIQAYAALETAIEMNIFDMFAPTDKPRTAEQLSAETGVEKLLLVRIMRGLTCSGIFNEVDEETYTHNARSESFTNPMFRTMMRGLGGTFSPYMNKLSEYLSSISFQNPGAQQQNLFQYATGTKQDFFEWLHTQPKQFEAFSSAMASSSAIGELKAVKMLSRLSPQTEVAEDKTLVVDVGGGRGKILNELRKARPDLEGAMIVQDLPKEIEGREPGNGVHAMAYDFFTLQPIKEAHTYFFRHIFHDWPDSSCRTILQQTIPAMKPGYSRLLIVDSVLPNIGASLAASLLDINMMALSGIERTERHWKELLEVEGLRVTKIIPPQDGRGNSVIEVVLE